MLTNDFIGDDKYKVAVIGSRTITDKKVIFEYLDSKIEKIGLIISGGALGVDSTAAEYARLNGIPLLVFYPKWKLADGSHDKGAGYRRNVLIVKEAQVVIAFQKDQSRGTQHSIDLAKMYNKILRVIQV